MKVMTFASISCLLAAHGVEARVLCIIQLCIEVVERDLYGRRGVIHGGELIVGGVEPSDQVGGEWLGAGGDHQLGHVV